MLELDVYYGFALVRFLFCSYNDIKGHEGLC